MFNKRRVAKICIRLRWDWHYDGFSFSLILINEDSLFFCSWNKQSASPDDCVVYWYGKIERDWSWESKSFLSHDWWLQMAKQITWSNAIWHVKIYFGSINFRFEDLAISKDTWFVKGYSVELREQFASVKIQIKSFCLTYTILSIFLHDALWIFEIMDKQHDVVKMTGLDKIENWFYWFQNYLVPSSYITHKWKSSQFVGGGG